MSFVKTPSGIIMHADNHRAAVEQAKKCDMRGLILMLEPAEPFDLQAAFGEGLQAKASPIEGGLNLEMRAVRLPLKP